MRRRVIVTAALREHASKGGFPANRISRIARVIDPTTSE
jgi:hypothetical protein